MSETEFHLRVTPEFAQQISGAQPFVATQFWVPDKPFGFSGMTLLRASRSPLKRPRLFLHSA